MKPKEKSSRVHVNREVHTVTSLGAKNGMLACETIGTRIICTGMPTVRIGMITILHLRNKQLKP